MIWKKYEDQTTDEVLQNRFTAYLTSAVSRRRAEYIDKLIQLQNQLNFNSANIVDKNFDVEEEVLKSFPLHLQIQNEDLFLSIAELSEQERYIFFNRALGELSLNEMAAELGINYKTVAAVYYRTIQKLKKRMQGGKNEI